MSKSIRILRISEQVQQRKIRILAVDHNPLLREGLSLLIQMQPDMELVGVVASAEEAVQHSSNTGPT